MKEPTAGRQEFSMVLVGGLDLAVDSTEARERMNSLLSDLIFRSVHRGKKRGGGRGKKGGLVFSIRAINGWVLFFQ
jgi:hypothetical protein